MCLSRARCLARHGILSSRKIREKLDKGEEDIITPEEYEKFPRSNTCIITSDRLATIRSHAENTLIHAWKIIHCRDEEEFTMEDINLKKESIDVLHKIKQELLKELKCESIPWTPHYDKYKKSKKYFYDEDGKAFDLESLSEDEEESIPYMESDEEYDPDLENNDDYDFVEEEEEIVPNNKEEEALVNKILDSIFTIKANCENSSSKKPTVMNTKALAEFTIYQEMLFQNFKCQDVSIPDKPDDFIFSKIDYTISVPEMMHYFVQPDVMDDELRVMAPNLKTLNVMEKILILRTYIVPVTSYLQRSKPLMEFLVDENKRIKPKCDYCINKGKRQTDYRTTAEQERQLLDNRKGLVIFDKRLKEAVDYETNAASKYPEKCECHKLPKIKERYVLLRKRFASMFLWPALCSCSPLTKEQQALLKKGTQ